MFSDFLVMKKREINVVMRVNLNMIKVPEFLSRERGKSRDLGGFGEI